MNNNCHYFDLLKNNNNNKVLNVLKYLLVLVSNLCAICFPQSEQRTPHTLSNFYTVS